MAVAAATGTKVPAAPSAVDEAVADVFVVGGSMTGLFAAIRAIDEGLTVDKAYPGPPMIS